MYAGADAELLDGFDVAFIDLVRIPGRRSRLKRLAPLTLCAQVVRQYLGLSVTFVPYPDVTSFYVGLRNGRCDFAAAGVELDPTRAACTASCPDTTVALLPVLPESDYITDPETYQLRLSQDICCLDYSTSYYLSGFSLMSRLHRTRYTVMDAIFSMVRVLVHLQLRRRRLSRGTVHASLTRLAPVAGNPERRDARAVRPDGLWHRHVAVGAPRQRWVREPDGRRVFRVRQHEHLRLRRHRARHLAGAAAHDCVDRLQRLFVVRDQRDHLQQADRGTAERVHY